MQDMRRTRLVIVLGMHRSGTSAITRGLSVLGVELGDRLMPPVEGNNAKGFWEDIDLNALNIEILRCLGSDWSHMALVPAADIERLRQQGFFLRAVELMRKKVGDAPYFGFKDPRVAKLLPFWREVFSHCGFDVSYVFAMRNPLSVVRSLGKRDGMESEQSYLLWLAHVVSGLSNSGGSPCVVVDYDRLMQAPEQELTRMAQGLRLHVDAAALQSYKEDFLDEELRHTVYVADDLLIDKSCPPLVHEVYVDLLEVACDRKHLHDAAVQERIQSWFRQYELMQAPLRLGDKLLAQKAELEGRLRSLQQSCADDLAVHNQILGERDARLAALEEQVKLLAQQAGHWEARAQESHALLVERSDQLHAANLARAAHGDQLHAANLALAAQGEQLHSANIALAAQGEQLHSANIALAAHNEQLQAANISLAAHSEQLQLVNATLAERDAQLSDYKARLAALRDEMACRDDKAIEAWNAMHP